LLLLCPEASHTLEAGRAGHVLPLGWLRYTLALCQPSTKDLSSDSGCSVVLVVLGAGEGMLLRPACPRVPP
jgi:hypothetical protein